MFDMKWSSRSFQGMESSAIRTAYSEIIQARLNFV